MLDVKGSVAAVEKAFRVTLRDYRHPKENRLFFAPDSEPSLDLTVPTLHISGLDNYALPHPNLTLRPNAAVQKGTFTGVVTASNGINPTFTQNYTITVAAVPASSSKPVLADAAANRATSTVHAATMPAWSQISAVDFSLDQMTNTDYAGGAVTLSGSAAAPALGLIANPSFEQSAHGFTGWTFRSQGNELGTVSQTAAGTLPSDGGRYARFYSKPSASVTAGDFSSITQRVNLSGISMIKFDAALGLGHTWNDRMRLEFLVDDVPAWSQAQASAYPDQTVDVSTLSGTRTVNCWLHMSPVEPT